MLAYGFWRVNTSHTVTPNDHTSDFCELPWMVARDAIARRRRRPRRARRTTTKPDGICTHHVGWPRYSVERRALHASHHVAARRAQRRLGGARVVVVAIVYNAPHVAALAARRRSNVALWPACRSMRTMSSRSAALAVHTPPLPLVIAVRPATMHCSASRANDHTNGAQRLVALPRAKRAHPRVLAAPTTLTLSDESRTRATRHSAPSAAARLAMNAACSRVLAANTSASCALARTTHSPASDAPYSSRHAACCT
jgi:hypothetical protein